jgi:hypothetical protein
MPALPPVSKVLKIVVQQLLTDAAAYLINRLFYQYSGTAPTDTQLDTFAGDVASAWITNITPIQCDVVTLKGVEVEDLTSATSAVGAAIANNVGTRTGSAPGAGMCFVVSNEIARRYRGGHPRNYLYAGVAGDLAAAFQWTSGFATTAINAWASLGTAIQASAWSGGGSLAAVNVSYYEGFTNHTYPSGRTRPIPTLRSSPVIDLVVNVIGRESVGSQRRRNEFND